MDATPPNEERRSGRPRGPSAATEYAVLSAAWHILTDEGITALTPTRLHAETGVARTTIYRHWPDPSAVVADIVAGATQRRVSGELSGDIRADLLAALGTLTFRLRHRPVGPLVAALLAGEATAGAEGPTSADYIEALLAPLHDAVVDGLSRGTLAVDRHQRAAGADVREIAGALVRDMVGPLMLDVLLLGGDPEAIVDDVVVDRFLDRHGEGSRTAAVPLLLQPDPTVTAVEEPDESVATAEPVVVTSEIAPADAVEASEPADEVARAGEVPAADELSG